MKEYHLDYQVVAKNEDGSLKLLDVLLTKADVKKYRPMLDSLNLFLIPTSHLVRTSVLPKPNEETDSQKS